MLRIVNPIMLGVIGGRRTLYVLSLSLARATPTINSGLSLSRPRLAAPWDSGVAQTLGEISGPTKADYTPTWKIYRLNHKHYYVSVGGENERATLLSLLRKRERTGLYILKFIAGRAFLFQDITRRRYFLSFFSLWRYFQTLVGETWKSRVKGWATNTGGETCLVNLIQYRTISDLIWLFWG